MVHEKVVRVMEVKQNSYLGIELWIKIYRYTLRRQHIIVLKWTNWIVNMENEKIPGIFKNIEDF